MGGSWRGFTRGGGSADRGPKRGATAVATMLLLAVPACAGGGTGGGAGAGAVGTSARITSYAGASTTSAISADGQWVAYLGDSPNANDSGDLYLWSRATQVAARLTSHVGNGPRRPGISADGRYVVFTSFDDLGGVVPGDSSPYAYSYDRISATFTYIAGLGNGINQDDDGALMSSDGSTVLYTAPNGALSSWSRATATSTTLVSGNQRIHPAAINANGTYTVFYTEATDVAGGPGLYRRDVSGVITAVLPGVQGNTSFIPGSVAVSYAGDVIYTLLSQGSSPQLIGAGVIKEWLAATQVTNVIVTEVGRIVAASGVSPEGRFVSYLSEPAPLDTNPLDGANPHFPAGGQAKLLDRSTGTTSVIAEGHIGVGELQLNAVSDDGRTVVYGSNDLTPGVDGNGADMDLFYWQQTS